MTYSISDNDLTPNVFPQVPFDYHVGVNMYGGTRCLAVWVQKQKGIYRKNMLPEKRTLLLESLGIDLTAKKKKSYRNKSINADNGPPLGEVMPDDDRWFQHEDGIRRRVPSTWEFPRLIFEEMYVIYHCQHLMGDEQQLSPMKLFEPSDMAIKRIYRRLLGELRLICTTVDRECRHRGVLIKGAMTEEEARKFVRIGCPGLNLPPMSDGKPRDILQMKCSAINKLRLKVLGDK